jgi:hypothetical protein
MSKNNLFLASSATANDAGDNSYVNTNNDDIDQITQVENEEHTPLMSHSNSLGKN